MHTTDLQTNLNKHETSQAHQKKLDNKKANQIKLSKVYTHVSLWTKKQEPAMMSLGWVNKDVAALQTCKKTNQNWCKNAIEKNMEKNLKKLIL